MNHARSSNGEARPESLTRLRAKFASIVESQSDLQCAEVFDRADTIAKKLFTEIEGRRASLYDIFNEAHDMGSNREAWRKKNETDLKLLVHLDHLMLGENLQTMYMNILNHFARYKHVFLEGSERNLEVFASSVVTMMLEMMQSIESSQGNTVKVVDPSIQIQLPPLLQNFDGHLSIPRHGFMPDSSIGEMLIGGQQGINAHDEIVIHGCHHMRCTTHARVQQLLFRLGMPLEQSPDDPINLWVNELGRKTDIHTLPSGCTMGTIVDSDLRAVIFKHTGELQLSGMAVPNRPGLRDEVLDKGGTLLPSDLMIAVEEILKTAKSLSLKKKPAVAISRDMFIS